MEDAVDFEDVLRKAKEIQKDLFDHGFGEMTFKIKSLRDNRVMIELSYGKTYVYFVKKRIGFSDSIL